MNYALARKISNLEEGRALLSGWPGYKDGAPEALKSLIADIARFNLEEGPDAGDGLSGWFSCRDQDRLMSDLGITEDQAAQLFGQATFKLRVQAEPEEGEGARSFDLFYCEDPGFKLVAPVNLLGALAAQDPYGITFSGSAAPILPGSPEFQDCRTIIDSFSQ